MSNDIILEYSFPDLGLITAPLKEESKELYQLIDSKTKSGIHYFRDLEHLGKLTEVYHGAHHSRWEYIFLQIYLIHELCEKKGLGISTEIKIGDYKISSVAELLKCWVLLTNFGHIKGVFESERVWFQILDEHNDIKQSFVSALPNNFTRIYAEKVFNHEEYFHLYYLLSALFLNGLVEYRKFKEFNKYLYILEALLKPSEIGTKVENAKGIFRKIRQASYILLDLNFSTLALKINSHLFFKNILNNPQQFLFDDDYHQNLALESVSACLFQEIYASIDATKYKFSYIEGQLKDFHNLLYKKSKKYFTKSKFTIYMRMLDYRQHDFGKFVELGEFKHELRLSLLPNEMSINRKRCKILSEKKYLENLIKNDAVRVFITPTLFNNNQGCFADYFVRNDVEIKTISPIILWASTKYILEVYNDWLFNDDLFHFASSDVLEQLFKYAVRTLIGSENIMKFRLGTSLEDYNVSLIHGKKKLKEWIRNERKEINRSNLSSSRIWELKAIRKIISSGKEGYFLVSEADILIQNKSGQHVAEFDGIFINVSRKKVKIYFIEAKDVQKSSRNKCKEALKNKIKKFLGSAPSKSIYTRTFAKKAYSYYIHEI